MIKEYDPVKDEWVPAKPIEFHEGFLGKIIRLFRRLIK